MKGQITLSMVVKLLFFSILVGIIFYLLGVDFPTLWGYTFDVAGSLTSYLLTGLLSFIQDLLFWWVP